METAPETFGPYSILGELGHGGMGAVYRARHRDLDREVALKLIGRTDAPELRVRFLREIRLSAQFRHPNLVSVLDAGMVGDVPYVAMELLPGETLAHRIKLTRRHPPSEVMAIGAQMAGGLAYLHERQIVHRDLKPANVMFAGTVVKLIDFGLARTHDSTHVTPTHNWVGTLIYCAPEVFSGEVATTTSDLWSLGCILYQLLVGRHPFSGDNAEQWIGRILRDPIAAPHTTDPGIPRELSGLVMGLLHRTAGQRPPAAVVASWLAGGGRGAFSAGGTGPTAVIKRSDPRSAPAAAGSKDSRPSLAWALGGLLLAVALGSLWRPAPSPVPAVVRPTAVAPASAASPTDIFSGWKRFAPKLPELLKLDPTGAIRECGQVTGQDLIQSPQDCVLWIRLGQWLANPKEVGVPSGSGPALARKLNTLDELFFRQAIAEIHHTSAPTNQASSLLRLGLDMVARWPGDGRGWLVLGKHLEACGRHEDGQLVNRIALDRVMEQDLSGSHPSLYAWFLDAVRSIPERNLETEWLRLIPQQKDRDHAWMAFGFYFLKTEPGRVEKTLRAALRRNPDDVDAIARLALSLQTTSADGAEVEALLQHGNRIAPRDQRLAHARWNYLITRGRPEEAAAALSLAGPNRYVSWIQQAFVTKDPKLLARIQVQPMGSAESVYLNCISLLVRAEAGDVSGVAADLMSVEMQALRRHIEGGPQIPTAEQVLIYVLVGGGRSDPWLLERARRFLTWEPNTSQSWNAACGECTTPASVPFMEEQLKLAAARHPSTIWPGVQRALWLSRRQLIDASLATLRPLVDRMSVLGWETAEILSRALWMEGLGVVRSRSSDLVAILNRLSSVETGSNGTVLQYLATQQWALAADWDKARFASIGGADLPADLRLIWGYRYHRALPAWRETLKRVQVAARYCGAGPWFEREIQAALSATVQSAH
jgi:serine/threonine protein kinase